MYRKVLLITLVIVFSLLVTLPTAAQEPEPEGGVTTVNGWYEGEEIYYIDHGIEEGVTERGGNQIYVIGDTPRKYQAQVVLFIPGEAGYSPHWNVNFVHTAEGVTLADILASPYASDLYPEALFDDGAEAPGNNEAPEDFLPFPDMF
jgi:hypothetical protein